MARGGGIDRVGARVVPLKERAEGVRAPAPACLRKDRGNGSRKQPRSQKYEVARPRRGNQPLVSAAIPWQIRVRAAGCFAACGSIRNGGKAGTVERFCRWRKAFGDGRENRSGGRKKSGEGRPGRDRLEKGHDAKALSGRWQAARPSRAWSLPCCGGSSKGLSGSSPCGCATLPQPWRP